MVVGQPPMVLASAVTAPAQLSHMCTLPGAAQGYIPVSSSEFVHHQPVSILPPSQPSSAEVSPTLVSPVTCSAAPPNNGTIFTFPPPPVPRNLFAGLYPCCIQTVPYKSSGNNISRSFQPVPIDNAFFTSCPPPMPPPTFLPSQQGMFNGTGSPYAQYSSPCQCATCSQGLTVTNSPPVYNFPPPPVSFAQSIVSRNVVTSWKQSYGMEYFWTEQFNKLFYMFSPHRWAILPVAERPGGLWYDNVDSAKVRFCCDTCGHGWTSMKGRVAFWFILNTFTCEGVVCLKLYGQQCDRCKRGDWQTAMWYPEEVEKVIKNIYNKVGQVYYGFIQAPYLKSRRAGKPRTPHNSALCQACQDGLCTERR